MRTILLSIKPEYCDRIFAGTKKFEFRKHLAQDDVCKIVIYSTAPEKKVLGEVEVKGTITMKKTPLWEYTKEFAGISREKYRQYFEKCAEESFECGTLHCVLSTACSRAYRSLQRRLRPA